MSDIFTFDYNEEDGEILFLSPIEGFDETVHEIYSIVIDNENEIEITHSTMASLFLCRFSSNSIFRF